MPAPDAVQVQRCVGVFGRFIALVSIDTGASTCSETAARVVPGWIGVQAVTRMPQASTVMPKTVFIFVFHRFSGDCRRIRCAENLHRIVFHTELRGYRQVIGQDEARGRRLWGGEEPGVVFAR